MSKLKSISSLVEIISRDNNQTIGLITGCFDVIHTGHIDLFRYAKKHVDILIVGLDNDMSIRISKGTDRPVNKFKDRAKLLEELSLVDHIFKVNQIFKFGDKNSVIAYSNIIKKIKPNIIFTNQHADKFWKLKSVLAKKNGMKLMLDKQKKINSSSNIIRLLNKCK